LESKKESHSEPETEESHMRNTLNSLELPEISSEFSFSGSSIQNPNLMISLSSSAPSLEISQPKNPQQILLGQNSEIHSFTDLKSNQSQSFSEDPLPTIPSFSNFIFLDESESEENEVDILDENETSSSSSSCSNSHSSMLSSDSASLHSQSPVTQPLEGLSESLPPQLKTSSNSKKRKATSSSDSGNKKQNKSTDPFDLLLSAGNALHKKREKYKKINISLRKELASLTQNLQKEKKETNRLSTEFKTLKQQKIEQDKLIQNQESTFRDQIQAKDFDLKKITDSMEQLKQEYAQKISDQNIQYQSALAVLQDEKNQISVNLKNCGDQLTSKQHEFEKVSLAKLDLQDQIGRVNEELVKKKQQTLEASEEKEKLEKSCFEAIGKKTIAEQTCESVRQELSKLRKKFSEEEQNAKKNIEEVSHEKNLLKMEIGHLTSQLAEQKEKFAKFDENYKSLSAESHKIQEALAKLEAENQSLKENQTRMNQSPQAQSQPLVHPAQPNSMTLFGGQQRSLITPPLNFTPSTGFPVN
jgi:chromosome segregation ATPase